MAVLHAKEETPLLTGDNPRLPQGGARHAWFKPSAIMVFSLCVTGALVVSSHYALGQSDGGTSCSKHELLSPLPPPASDPLVIVQYGHPRTATTLQFQALCALTKVMHPDSRVKCTFLHMNWWSLQPGGFNPESSGDDGYDYLVLKVHQLEVLNRLWRLWQTPVRSRSVWIFHSVALDGDWALESVDHQSTSQMMGTPQYISCTSVDELKERGLGGLLEKYRRFFRASNDAVNLVREYIEPWDKLRLCCGEQMSKAHAFTLLGRAGELTPEERAHEAQTCGVYDLRALERAVIDSSVFHNFSVSVPAISHLEAEEVTNLHPSQPQLTGSYCANYRPSADWIEPGT